MMCNLWGESSKSHLWLNIGLSTVIGLFTKGSKAGWLFHGKFYQQKWMISLKFIKHGWLENSQTSHGALKLVTEGKSLVKI